MLGRLADHFIKSSISDSLYIIVKNLYNYSIIEIMPVIDRVIATINV